MVEIIPKPPIKKSKIQIAFFCLSVIIFFSLVSIFFILNNFFQEKLKISKELDIILKGIKTPEKEILEKELREWEIKINDFSYLLDKHLAVSKFFPFLESLSFPGVHFNKISINAEKGEIQLLGEIESFKKLNQQEALFKKERKISNVKLSKVFLIPGAGGKVNFEFNLSLLPEVLIF